MSSSCLKFGDFELDPVNADLVRGGAKIKLAPKAFSVLFLLLESKGRLITKDELLDTVWPGVVVGDAVLKVHIGHIRKALGDDPRTPKYIKTIHRRGYRFVAPVTPVSISSRGRELTRGQSDTQVLVGRAEAMDALNKCYQDCVSGCRQVVLISGEPGIGKTTLASTFLERNVQQSQILITTGQCIDHHGSAEAYLPIFDALGRLCRGDHREIITDLLKQNAPNWLRQMPGILSACEYAELQADLSGDTQERMLREIVESIEALTEQCPVLILLEDLQWSDHATLDVLGFLAKRKEPARLLVLGTYRPVDVIVTDHPLRGLKESLRAHGLIKEIPLELLTQNDIREFLAERFGEDSGHFQEGLSNLLHRHTNGNPLFVVNYLVHLQHKGLFKQENGIWYLSDDFNDKDIDVPASLRDFVSRQIQQLSEHHRSILEAASVAGTQFSVNEVAAALDQAEADIEMICEQLARNSSVLRWLNLQTWPDETLKARYEFCHALYREVIYEGLAPIQKAVFHKRIGTRLERAYRNDTREIATQLAVHFEAGHDYRRSIDYFQQAGETAYQRFANYETTTCLEKALTLLTHIPKSDVRDRQELKIQTTLGPALISIKGKAAAEVEHAYLRAEALCRQLGNEQALGTVLTGLCMYYSFKGEHRVALRRAESFFESTAVKQDPRLGMMAHIGIGSILFTLGEFSAARMQLDAGFRLYDVERHASLALTYGQDFGVLCLSTLAAIYWLLGYPKQAIESNTNALSLARQIKHPFSQASAMLWSAELYQHLRDSVGAQAHARSLKALANEHRFSGYAAAAAIIEAAEEVRVAPSQTAMADLENGLEIYQGTGAQQILPYFQGLTAEAYQRLGQYEAAIAILEKALEQIKHQEERWWEAELYRLLGEILIRQGAAKDEIESTLLWGLEVARHQKARSLELRSVMSLAHYWRQHGNTTRARQLLQRCYDGFTEGFDTSDLIESVGLLAQFEG